MATHVFTEQASHPAHDKAKGPAAPATGNVDQAQQARRARAMSVVAMVPERWRTPTQGLFDIDKPVNTAFTPAMFRALTYDLVSVGAKNGMNVDEVGAVSPEEQKIIFEALGGDKDREPYMQAFAQAMDAQQRDLPHLLALGTALDDVMHGGDVKWNTKDLLGHYAPLSNDAKRWLAKAPKTAAFKKYATGPACEEHGAMEATHALAADRKGFTQMLGVQGGVQRKGACIPIWSMLEHGALGAGPVEDKTDKKDGAPNAAAQGGPAGAGGAAATDDAAAANEAIEKKAQALIKKIEEAIAKHSTKDHGENTIRKAELKKLIAEIEAAEDKVKDRLYAKPELMQTLMQLEPGQMKQVVAKLDTVQGLYETLEQWAPEPPRGPASGMYESTGAAYRGRIPLDEKVYPTIETFLTARPGKENTALRMRVLQHEMLKARFIDNCTSEQRAKIYKLVANGTLEPTVLDKLRDAARAGNGVEAARALMKLGSDSPGEFEPLKADHIFRKEIENVDKEVVVDGFTVNAYHLCLTFWGLDPLSTKDATVDERQTEVDLDGKVGKDGKILSRPLTIEQKMTLETKLLDPYATSLRAEIHSSVVEDDIMKDICQSYERAQVYYIPMFRQLGKAPGPALTEYYNKKYSGHDLRGEVNEYVSDSELVECNRILGFSVDSASVGIINGQVTEHGAQGKNVDEKTGKIYGGVAQALRETKDDKGIPLSQITSDYAQNISNWLYEPQGWQPPMMMNIGAALRYPGVNKDEFLKAWESYSNIITSRKKEIASKTTLGPEQIHAIEFLQNAVMEKGGDLAGKIKRFYGPGVFSKDESADILKEMGLRAEDAQARSKAAQDALIGSDPVKGLEQKAKDTYGQTAAQLFEAIARLPPPAELAQLTPIAVTFKQRIIERLPEAPPAPQAEPAQQAQGAAGPAAPAMPKSIEERPPRSFVGYYRLEYGIDPTTHITRVLKNHRDRGTDVAAAAQLFGVEVPQTIEPPKDDELKITEANKALVRPSFTEAIARQVAREIWDAFHDGTRLNVVMTKLYTEFADEEQRLIRMGFREISGGIDIQFYLQQRLLQKKTGGDMFGQNTSEVTLIGGEATDVGKKLGATDKTEIKIGETDVNELTAAVTAAKEGTVDCYAMMKSAANNRDVDGIMRLADEAEKEDRSKILQDRELMDQLRSACDAVAWDRVYKTLTNQADLVDRLYQRGAGLGTDEKGMREDIKAHVKRLRKRFRKQLTDAAKAKDPNAALDSDGIEQQVQQMVRDECQRLMSNISIRRIIEEELSDEELSEVESLIINAGETTTQSEVVREGNDAEKIIAGIRNTDPKERARLRGDARYLELLAERLRNPNDYRQAMDALMSDRAGEGVLDKVDEGATKDKSRMMLRDLVDLSPTELKQLQADPGMQAKLLATFDDPEKRALARDILQSQLARPDAQGGETKPADADAAAQQDPAKRIAQLHKDEEKRIEFLKQNAVFRLRVPVIDKLGWPSMLTQCVEVYKMELERRVDELDPKTNQLRAFSEGEAAGDRAQREQTALAMRQQIWHQVKNEVAVWAFATEKDKPKRTLSDAWTANQMIDIVRAAVLHERDPSSESLKENLGATVEMADPYSGGYDLETGKAKTRKVELDNDYDGIKKTINAASDQVLVNEWSSVLREPHTGGPSLKQVYVDYTKAKETTKADGELEPTAAAQEVLFKKKMAFVNYTLDISAELEGILLPHIGASDERKSAKELGLGQVGNLKDRDNKKYNELLDLARGRIIRLTKDDGRFLVARAIGIDPNNDKQKEDWSLLDTPNRDTSTNFAYRDSKYLRSRGTEAGSGWAAHDEAQFLDLRMMQYNHEVAAVQTNTEGGRGMVTKEEAGKVEEKGAEMERALQAFKDAKAKVAMWMSLIIGALVTAVLTVLTGGLATGPLAALFFTTAIAGVSAGAKALVNEAVLAEDYDLSDEGVKMIGSEMLTAFITAGTTMLAQKAMAGLQGVSKLARQVKVIEGVQAMQPPIWRGFLVSAGEGALQAGMQGVVEAGLTAVDPVYWMHGFAEGRDRAIPAMKDQLSAVPMHMLKAGMTSLITSGVLHFGSKKKDIAAMAEQAQHSGRINLKENFKKVFGNNGTRALNVFMMWATDHVGHKIDIEAVPAELLQGWLNDLSQQNINVHTETAHEGSRSARAERDVEKFKHQMTASEQAAFMEMNARSAPSDPYVTVGEFLNTRTQLTADRLNAWGAQHPDKSLTSAQCEAFSKWVREAPTGKDFADRLKVDPETVDAVKKAKDAPPADAPAADKQVDGHNVSAADATPVANDNVAGGDGSGTPHEKRPFPEATTETGEPMSGEEMIAKYGTRKGEKHKAAEPHAHQPQKPHPAGEQAPVARKPKTAAEVFNGAEPHSGTPWTFVSETGNRYEGEFQGIDETGHIVVKTSTGVTGRIDPSRIASARSGVSVPELHEFGPHDRITLYGLSGSERHGTIEGYTSDGNVYFKNEKTGETEILKAGMLDLAKTQRANEKTIHTEATDAAKLEREKNEKKQAEEKANEEKPTEKAVEQKATDPAHQEKAAGEAVSTERDPNKPLERDVRKDLPNIDNLTALGDHVIGAHQASRVAAAVKALPEAEYHAFRALHDSLNGSPVAQAFLLKALAAHNSMADLQWLATEMAFKPNEWLVDNLTLGDPRGVGGGVQQQWSMSCNASTTVTLRGNYDPVFALKMRYANKGVHQVDINDPMQWNAHQAQLEQQLLQSPYSGQSHPELQGQAGVAVPHAQGASTGRWADDILSAQHDVTGMKFATTKNPKPEEAAATLIRSLKKGMQVPIVVGDYAGAFTHYVLVMQIRNTGAGNEFQIHNTGDGTTTWVTQKQILEGNMGLNGGNMITAIEVPTATPHPDEAAQQVPTDAQAQAQPATDPAHAGASHAATAPPTAATQRMAAVTVADAPAIATTAVAVVTEQLPTSSLATRLEPTTATDPAAKSEQKTVEVAAVPQPVQNVVQMILHGKAVNAAREIQAMEAKAAAVTAQEQARAQQPQSEAKQAPQQKPGAHDPAYEQFTQEWKGQPADLKQFKEFFDVGYEDAIDKVRRAMQDPQVRQLLAHVPEDELAAIVLYTQTYFVEMNSALRNRDKESMKDFGNGIKLADKGLAKMPVHEGWVHRGVESLPAEVLAKYVPGVVVTEEAFTSTSQQEDAAFAGKVKFNILSKTGRDVRQLSRVEAEKEVLFRPGTKFIVVDKVRDGDSTIITMEEVQAPAEHAEPKPGAQEKPAGARDIEARKEQAPGGPGGTHSGLLSQLDPAVVSHLAKADPIVMGDVTRLAQTDPTEFSNVLRTYGDAVVDYLRFNPASDIPQLKEALKNQAKQVRHHVDDLYTNVTPASQGTTSPAAGWSVETKREGGRKWESTIRDPNGQQLEVGRAWDPASGTLTMDTAFGSPKIDKVPSDPALVASSGTTPAMTYVNLAQMRAMGIPYGKGAQSSPLHTVKMSTIQNIETIGHLHWLRQRFPNATVDELIVHTASYRYASDIMLQAGYRVTGVHVDMSGRSFSLDSLLAHYEDDSVAQGLFQQSGKERAGAHDKMLERYGINGKDVRDHITGTDIKTNFNIYLKVEPIQ